MVPAAGGTVVVVVAAVVVVATVVAVASEVDVVAAVVTVERDPPAVVSVEADVHAETTRAAATTAMSFQTIPATFFCRAFEPSTIRHANSSQKDRDVVRSASMSACGFIGGTRLCGGGSPGNAGDLDGRVAGDDTGGMRDLARSSVVLGAIGAAVAVVVVVGLVLALQPPKQFDPGTPEAAIQGYFQAVVDRSRVDAERFMTPKLVERCGADLNQIRDTADSLRVVIVDTEPDAGRIAVTVEITERSASSVFLGEPNTFSETLVVERVGDGCLIAEAPWPIYCWEA